MRKVFVDPIVTDTVDLWRRLGLEELYKEIRETMVLFGISQR